MTDDTTEPMDTPIEEGPDEFPDPDELPDESVDIEDIDPFDEDTEDYDDLNEFAEAEWKEQTTVRERVREVIKRTASPKSASEIAELAKVSVSAARKHLNDLAEQDVVRIERTSNGNVYQRDPDWYLMRRVRRLSESEHLVDQIQTLQQEINEYREKYGPDSPEEIVVSDGILSEEELEDVTHWRTATRNLEYLRAAYRFREAKNTVARESRSPSGSEDILAK